MIRCKIRKHTKAVAVLILCVAVCIILIAAFGGERKIPFFGTWRIEREVIIPELTPGINIGNAFRRSDVRYHRLYRI